MLLGMRFMLLLICASFVSCMGSNGWAAMLAQFRTALGDIDVQLYDSEKPATVQNFIQYVQSGVYDNMFLHRWVPGFVVQGGGYFITNRHQTNAVVAEVPSLGTVTNEYGVGRIFSNQYGTIAMARVSGQTNSATSQWFFNLTNNAFLDQVEGGFTVFGRVVQGTNVLNRFNDTSVTNGIYVLPAQAPFTELPVLSRSPTLEDLVYVDVTLLNVQVTKQPDGTRQITWQSVSNKVNRVEFTTQIPPAWQVLATTNGTGRVIHIADPQLSDNSRFYRVRVDY